MDDNTDPGTPFFGDGRSKPIVPPAVGELPSARQRCRPGTVEQQVRSGAQLRRRLAVGLVALVGVVGVYLCARGLSCGDDDTEQQTAITTTGPAVAVGTSAS